MRFKRHFGAKRENMHEKGFGWHRGFKPEIVAPSGASFEIDVPFGGELSCWLTQGTEKISAGWAWRQAWKDGHTQLQSCVVLPSNQHAKTPTLGLKAEEGGCPARNIDPSIVVRVGSLERPPMVLSGIPCRDN